MTGCMCFSGSEMIASLLGFKKKSFQLEGEGEGSIVEQFLEKDFLRGSISA